MFAFSMEILHKTSALSKIFKNYLLKRKFVFLGKSSMEKKLKNLSKRKFLKNFQFKRFKRIFSQILSLKEYKFSVLKKIFTNFKFQRKFSQNFSNKTNFHKIFIIEKVSIENFHKMFKKLKNNFYVLDTIQKKFLFQRRFRKIFCCTKENFTKFLISKKFQQEKFYKMFLQN